ncbi:hypothetical protein MRX96_026647, partial [Rhipicephalus microplus]
EAALREHHHDPPPPDVPVGPPCASPHVPVGPPCASPASASPLRVSDPQHERVRAGYERAVGRLRTELASLAVATVAEERGGTRVPGTYYRLVRLGSVTRVPPQ